MKAIDDGDGVDATVVRSREDFAKLLRARRRELGLSQEELAGVVGIHRTVLSMIESGRRPIMLERALHLMQALGMDVVIRSRPR